MKTTPLANQPLLESEADDEIDLRQVIGALFRCWPWIAGGGTLGLLFSGIYLLKTKPVYQAEFQIVLNNVNLFVSTTGLFSLLHDIFLVLIQSCWFLLV